MKVLIIKAPPFSQLGFHIHILPWTQWAFILVLSRTKQCIKEFSDLNSPMIARLMVLKGNIPDILSTHRRACSKIKSRSLLTFSGFGTLIWIWMALLGVQMSYGGKWDHKLLSTTTLIFGYSAYAFDKRNPEKTESHSNRQAGNGENVAHLIKYPTKSLETPTVYLAGLQCNLTRNFLPQDVFIQRNEDICITVRQFPQPELYGTLAEKVICHIDPICRRMQQSLYTS